MSYENAISTKMLATHCLICGRALVDAVSVERGVGPECWSHVGSEDGLNVSARKEVNILVHHASLDAVAGRVAAVRAKAARVRELGFGTLADKMVQRFKNAEKHADIKIEVDGEKFLVKTPYRRGKADEFIAAWRRVPGRYWDGKRKANVVPSNSKTQLWELLQEFFPGKSGVGPKGAFRVPSAK